MKKSFLLLPLSALALAACSSNEAPVVNASSSGSDLSPGIMQPVASSDAMGTEWQTSAQSVEMPTEISTEYVAPQTVSEPAATKTTTVKAQTVKTSTASQREVSQNFEIPRDENNAPIYSQIEKGFYNGDTYTVRKGDTMFLIAYIAGKDVKEVAALNNMSEPYQLRVGQKLKLGNTKLPQATAKTSTPKEVEPEVTYTSGANGTTYASDGNITGPVKAGEADTTPAVRATAGVASTATSTVVATTSTTPVVRATTSTSTVGTPSSKIKWQWPTKGRVTQGFSTAEGGNKGIDIAGSKGQDVYAAAAGKVVYAGNALQGYGNLIIIKHDDDFLSAYAHNDKIKVSEQEKVKAGEKIATLGSTGTNSNKLHFEIRYKGKSVNPTSYLPKR